MNADKNNLTVSRSHSLTVSNIEELPDAARAVLSLIGNHKVVAFYGTMGAGKTTLIKALCAAMGISATVNSPTFSIVNEYRRPTGEPVYHFDFYRINKIEEVYDFGYEEYFYSGQLCLIEWPELIEPLLPAGTLKLHINIEPDGRRSITSVNPTTYDNFASH